MDEALAKALNNLRDQAYFTARDHVFHEGEVNDGLMLALIHSEVSEALDALRQGNPPDKHCPQCLSLACELADIIIRTLDYAGVQGIDIGGAVLAKMEYNKNRPYKHGKKF